MKLTLSERMANTAINVAVEEFLAAKTEVEDHINRIALSGQRSTIIYPGALVKKYRQRIVKWLQDEGFNVTYTSCQRDGEFLNISF